MDEAWVKKGKIEVKNKWRIGSGVEWVSRATFILLEVVGIGVTLHHRNARIGKPEDAKRQAGAQCLPINGVYWNVQHRKRLLCRVKCARQPKCGGKENRCDRLDRNNNGVNLQQVCSPQLMAAALFRLHNRKVLATPFSSTDLLGKQSCEVLLHKISEVQRGKNA